MSVLLVLVAHDGRTLQLDVQGQTRVEAVQQALVSVTGINVSDQIIMCHGARLDPAKPLSAYKLPVGDPTAAEDQPVFLYHKAYLRPGATPPPAEPLPVLDVAVPKMPSVQLRHPLQAAHSPLIRALPDYEAQFQQQLGEARAYWEASQQRLHKCRQLMSEQEVQARAADAARANVETHYNYIANMYSNFVDKYVAQHRHHSQLLSQFASLSAAMETIELPPQLATPQWKVLADLQPHRGRLQEWHDSCGRSHEHFASKVAELESVFQLLRQDVERLFLQAPSVDLDALGLQLNDAEGLIDEQGSIVQVLSKDLLTVRQLVEDVVAQLGGSAGGASLSGAAVHDTCAAVDTMHDKHLQSLLPRVHACDASVTEFLLRCADAKGRMTKDVLLQLQGIAAQQNRIRDIKHKLALFNEVLARQAAAFAELQTATRLPAAYRLALAECARRAAWQEMFAGQANRLAEHCGRITAKEASKRESVRRQLERYLPVELLARAGLLQDPPHCTVSVPPSESLLLPVTPADIARLPSAIQQAAESAAVTHSTASAAATDLASSRIRSGAVTPTAKRVSSSEADSSSEQQLPPQGKTPQGSELGSSSRVLHAGVPLTPTAATAAGASTLAGSTWFSAARPVGDAAAAAAPADMSSNLALENARLRAELAAVLAQEAAKELGDMLLPSSSSSSSGGAAATAPGGVSMLGSSIAVGMRSISLAASAAAATPSRSAAAAAAAAAEASSAAAAKPYGHGGAAVVPLSVAAPLPSPTTTLQKLTEQDQQAAAAAAGNQALALAPVQAALAAKDELIHGLEARVQGLAADVAGYEARIQQLEVQLAAQVTSRLVVQQQYGDQQEEPQQQQQQQEVESAVEPAAAASDVMQQSVAPAFVLDATQVGSFFGGPSGGDGSQQGSAAAATAAVAGAIGMITAVDGQQQQQQTTPTDQMQQPQSVATRSDSEPQTAGATVQQVEGTTVEQQQKEVRPEQQEVQTTEHKQQQERLQEPQQQHLEEQQGTAEEADLAVMRVVDKQLQEQQQQQEEQVEAKAASSSAGEQMAGAGVWQHGGEQQQQLTKQLQSAGEGPVEPQVAPKLETSVAGQQEQHEQQGPARAAAAAGGAESVPPSVVTDQASAVPAAAGTADAAAAAASSAAFSAAGAGSMLSVSEPDLRAVMVAQPADVEADQQRSASSASSARCTRSSSVEPATMPIPQGHGDASAATAAPAPAGSTGLTSLLSSSMHYLFQRSSNSSSSKGDGSSNSAASPVVSPPAVSPPMSPPARRSPAVQLPEAAAAAASSSAGATAPSGSPAPEESNDSSSLLTAKEQ